MRLHLNACSSVKRGGNHYVWFYKPFSVAAGGKQYRYRSHRKCLTRHLEMLILICGNFADSRFSGFYGQLEVPR